MTEKILVTIEISDHDWLDMMRHFAKGNIGRPMVAVHSIIEAHAEPTDDRPMSRQLIAMKLADVDGGAL